MASILQRAVLHHPDHESVPAELSINRTVLEFLTESIDQFLIGPAPSLLCLAYFTLMDCQWTNPGVLIDRA